MVFRGWHVRKRQDGLTGAGGGVSKWGERGGERWGRFDTQSRLNHRSRRRTDGRSAVCEAGMPRPLEIERASRAGRRPTGDRYCSPSALFIRPLIRPDKTVRLPQSAPGMELSSLPIRRRRCCRVWCVLQLTDCSSVSPQWSVHRKCESP